MAPKLMTALIVVGAVAFVAFAGTVGIAFLQSSSSEHNRSPSVYVADLLSIPDDGIPRRFPLIVKQRDAWQILPDRIIGHVYLRRSSGTSDIVALDFLTPFGSVLTFDEKAGIFTEPCWGMKYNSSGECLNEPHPGNIRRME